MRKFAASLALLTSVAGSAAAQGQPPVRSAQDAACREDARARLLSTPNPQGLSLYDLGAQIYRQCMARAQPAPAPQRRRG